MKLETLNSIPSFLSITEIARERGVAPATAKRHLVKQHIGPDALLRCGSRQPIPLFSPEKLAGLQLT
jgi:hypothetical protein